MDCFKKKTTTDIVKPHNLKKGDINSMFNLFQNYYENTNFNSFQTDLNEKNVILLLKDKISKIIVGFTTIEQNELILDNTKVLCFFSGDTIIDKEYRGDGELQKTWWKYIKSIKTPNKKYWILISKGHKTYRLLPRYFKRYYPNYNLKIPEFEDKILNKYMTKKYSNRYNSKKGIVILREDDYFLREKDAIITKKELKQETIKYFLKKNPEYKRGTELVCITELSDKNLKFFTKLYLNGNLIISTLMRIKLCIKKALSK